MMNPFEESTIDWENDSIDTVTREANDEHIKLLQAEDEINNIGDGGTSNGKARVKDMTVFILFKMG
jgi:hypothetical protein